MFVLRTSFIWRAKKLILRSRPHLSGYFWICNFFFPDSKISHVHTCPYSNRICPSTRIRRVSGFTRVSGLLWKYWQQSMRRGRHLEYSIRGKGLGSILWHHWIKKCPDIASTWFRVHSVFKIFHSGERIQKVTDSYAGFTRYRRTEAVSGKNKLRIQNYPDTWWTGP